LEFPKYKLSDIKPSENIPGFSIDKIKCSASYLGKIYYLIFFKRSQKGPSFAAFS